MYLWSNKTKGLTCLNLKLMDNSKTAILMVFHSIPQAKVIKGLLSANGISSFLSNEETAILTPLYGQQNESIRLYVLEKDLALARSILTGGWTPNADDEEDDMPGIKH